MDELVSIIMPSYNTGKYIKESIQSVINQTYENWELIIIDDCSNDDTDSIVEGIGDSRIVFIKNEENSGAALSRNKALTLAKGRWIAFLDSDDIWYPSKLELQIRFMKNHNYHFSYTKYEEIDEDSKSLGIEISGPKKITRPIMYAYCWPGCLTVMYDYKSVGLIQIENIKKNNDYAIWLKISSTNNCFLLDKTLAKYRKRQGSISNQNYIELIKWHFKLFRVSLHKSIILSSIYTIINLIFGLIKKFKYRSKIK